MKIIKLIFLFSIFSSIQINAQEIEADQTLESGTIDQQFNYMIKKSYSYKEYKNVKLTWLYRIQKAVDDTLNLSKNEIKTLKQTLDGKNIEIKGLTSDLKLANETIGKVNNEKNSIHFLGFLILKSVYNTLLWSLISILLALLLIFIFRFNRSNSKTITTNKKFEELEIEYDKHKLRNLEREQQLRRKLQDEINKQRNEK